MFKETHPILGAPDIQRAIAFYTQQLGFKLAFGDIADPPNYVWFRRDAVELHMQFQFENLFWRSMRLFIPSPSTKLLIRTASF